MTIALGFLTNSALVFAADSQESDGATKEDSGKISISSSVSREGNALVGNAVAVTGAGDAGLLRYLRSDIIRRFREDLPSIDEFEIYLRSKIRNFHRLHVAIAPPGLSVDLIIGAQSRGERGMWVTSLSTVRKVQSYAVVGSGGSWARRVLEGFIPAAVNESSAIVIAAYAAFVAKKHADGCGMDTSVSLIDRGSFWKPADSSALGILDGYFRDYEHRNQVERLSMLGMPVRREGEQRIDLFLGSMWEKIAGLDFFPLPEWARNLEAQQDLQSTTADPSPQQPSPESPGGSDAP